MGGDYRVPKKAAVLKHLEKFLKDHVESDTGGWAPVSKKDWEAFHNIVDEIVRCKWGPDADGDRPINFSAIDRTKHEGAYWFPLPYMHKAESMDEIDSIIDTAMSNMKMATDRVSNLMQIRRMRKEDELRDLKDKDEE